jgi:hypothetical protein
MELAMKRLLPIAVLGATATIAVILVTVPGGAPTAPAFDPLAQAAEATTHAGGARMSIAGTLNVTNLPTPVRLAGGGHENFNRGEGELTLSIAGLPVNVGDQLHGSSLQMTEIFKAGALYIGSPLFAGKLPGGAAWMKLDLSRVGAAIGLDPGSLTSGGSNPAQYLRELSSAGATSSIAGHELVRGVPTTHYVGKLDLLKAAEAQPGTDRAELRAAVGQLASHGEAKIPVEVWVDAHRLVRRLAIALSAQQAGQHIGASLQIEYFGFGPTPSVDAPAASEVLDVTQNSLKGLSATG